MSLSEVVLFLKSITDDISEENIEKIFEELDSTGDKMIEFDEFQVISLQEKIFFYMEYAWHKWF